MSKRIHTGYVECPNCGCYTDDMYLPPGGGSPFLPYWCGGCVRSYAADVWSVLSGTHDVWCDECGGYIACDLAPQIAQRYADHHGVEHNHEVWIDVT